MLDLVLNKVLTISQKYKIKQFQIGTALFGWC